MPNRHDRTTCFAVHENVDESPRELVRHIDGKLRRFAHVPLPLTQLLHLSGDALMS